MTDLYAVMGNPVAHSKSPFIHSAFAKQTGQDIEYRAMLVEPGNFAAAVTTFFDQGGKGLNITVPFKQEAWALAKELSGLAQRAQAVNTLMLNKQGLLVGHNTDGPGLIRDIRQNNSGVLHDKRILVLGAGGAARGILQPLLREQPELLVVANRTRSKAEDLQKAFAEIGEIHACTPPELAGTSFDWIINATAASLEGKLPELPDNLLRPQAWCYDLMYATEPTVFCRWAKQEGAAKIIDGLGMLVEQAAEAFRLWRGTSPDTASVLQQLRT